MEVWLPASGWNGKFQAVGNGGFAGTVPYAAMARAVLDGYATAGTDTGHVGNNAEFALGHPEKLVDFGYRAVHEMAVAAKRVIDAHYGRAPQFSYFNGCSQGGRQGITSAQRYPADFDGIVAGAAAWDQMRSHAARLALNLTMNRSPEAVIPPEQVPDDPRPRHEELRRPGRRGGRCAGGSHQLHRGLLRAGVQGRRRRVVPHGGPDHLGQGDHLAAHEAGQQ